MDNFIFSCQLRVKKNYLIVVTIKLSHCGAPSENSLNILIKLQKIYINDYNNNKNKNKNIFLKISNNILICA